MPLLDGKPLKPHKYLRKLKDDEEVFYCELTEEIFEDYKEYCERVISCNCMIWSCAITGKTELTYKEALDSEEKALKNIKDFAPELRTPVLYLASLTSITHFAEMADSVYDFVKNRFFVGESVQACFGNDGENWFYAQVLNVLMPTAEEVVAYGDKHKLPHPIQHRPYPAQLYKYELEEVLDEDDDDDDEPQEVRIITVTSDKVRRMKGLYTKSKNRAYLKQFTEQRKNGLWRVKSAIMAKYGITTIDFRDIFIGETPILLKEPEVSISPLKINDLKQTSMKKFLVNKLSPSKNGLLDKGKSKSTSKQPESKKSPKKSVTRVVAKKIQKKYIASIDRVATNKDAAKLELRQKKLELMRKQKEAKRQEKEKLERFAKEWQRKREDLECEDLKELPVPCPVDCRVSNELFGQFIMILEFFTCFRDVLKAKDFFPYGLSFEMLERALVDVEVAGPFSDILQLLLKAVFVFQGDEEDEVKQGALSVDIDMSLHESAELSAREAMQAATLAARWSQTYHNVPLNKLHLDAITVTDILRLHLLASGGRAGDLSAKWRLLERGGYVNTDDPGLEFRRTEPQILKFLSLNSVAALPVPDKLKVVACLMNQILSYASVRDVLDERYDNVFMGKRAIKIEQAEDGRKEKERVRKVKEEKGEKPSAEERERLGRFAALRKEDHQRRLGELRASHVGFQLLPLGRDRAYRRYWVFSALSGLFVEDDEQWPGHCLPQSTIPCQTPTDEDDTMSYIRKLFEAGRSSTGSDKENEGEGNQLLGTPKKKHLGESNGVSMPSPVSSEHKSPVKAEVNRSLVCTANQETCSVHNTSIERTKWLFFYKEDEVEELIKSLNKRGYREGALRETLNKDKDRIFKHISKCPVQKLNRFVPMVASLPVNKIIGTRSMKGYDDANLKFPAGTAPEVVIEMYLRDSILDTEDKIFHGGLGCLKVDNRKAWREEIEARSFDSQDPDLTWPTKMTSQHNKTKEEDDPPSRSVTPCSEHSSHNDSSEDTVNPDQAPAVRDLAMAVLQLARSVQPKYLQKPLPFEEKRPVKLTAMERWELSLMHSTSFSQVYLHHASLDNSIQWNKSVLNAKCKICRRGKDDINMLLCDGCDRGFHLYCLKPKLTSIPRGDWFCPDCRPAVKAPIQRSSRRRLLMEEEDEEEEDTDDEPLSRSRSSKRRRRDDSIDDHRPKRTR